MVEHSIAVEFDIEKKTYKEIDIHSLHLDEEDPNKLYWIHCSLNQQELFTKLSTELDLPSHIKKLYAQNTLQNIAEHKDAVTIRLECLLSSTLSKHNTVQLGQLILHVTKKFCFTASYKKLPALVEFSQSYQKGITYAKTPCFILFLLIDHIINQYAEVVLNFELVVDKIDCEAHDKEHHTYHHIMDIKQQVIKTKRQLIILREILLRLSGRNIPVISPECRTSLANLSNHCHMVINELDSIRDILNSLLDQIDNILMQRMNETMRLLTAFSAIFLPLSLITGIYGMNFRWIPELSWKYGYFYVLGLIFLCVFGLAYLFKRWKWF